MFQEILRKINQEVVKRFLSPTPKRQSSVLPSPRQYFLNHFRLLTTPDRTYLILPAFTWSYYRYGDDLFEVAESIIILKYREPIHILVLDISGVLIFSDGPRKLHCSGGAFLRIYKILSDPNGLERFVFNRPDFYEAGILVSLSTHALEVVLATVEWYQAAMGDDRAIEEKQLVISSIVILRKILVHEKYVSSRVHKKN